jgi:hypothetical protein
MQQVELADILYERSLLQAHLRELKAELQSGLHPVLEYLMEQTLRTPTEPGEARALVTLIERVTHMMALVNK